jgi:TRAP-type mannitol/chloroaromatic compound transport system substrate-binding protein
MGVDSMKRRVILQAAGLAALGASPAVAEQAKGKASAQIHWKMVTAWPKNYPGAGDAANRLAARIHAMSDGRLNIKVYGAGELVPALEVFDAVSAGTAEMGHAAAHYWTGKVRAAAFFSAVPFGMTANEMNAWLYYGGGLALWREVYAPFDLLPMPAGNGGVQMGGWFRKPIERVEDFRGLKIRMAGLGGAVLRRLGALPVTMPVGEVFTSLQSGVLDAAEFAGPYSDMPMGLHKVAKYYYTPGWHEPASPIECIINRQAYQRIPGDLQVIVDTACQAMTNDVFAELTARNADALRMLVEQHQVNLSYFPEPVIDSLREQTAQVLADYAGKDATTRRVQDSYQQFAQRIAEWTAVADEAYLEARRAPVSYRGS